MMNIEQAVPTMSRPITIIHADPQAMVRAGIRNLLASNNQFQYLAECSSADEVVGRVESMKPDVLLLELGLPDKSGIEVIRTLKASKLKTKVIVVSGFEDEATILQALHAGADGYISKSASPEQLASTVSRALSSSEAILPENLAHLKQEEKKLSSNGANESNGHFSLDPLGKLSKREREVFYLLAEGHPNRVIAKQLFISPRTVETHRARVIRKLGFDNTADLIKYAIRNNLMPL